MTSELLREMKTNEIKAELSENNDLKNDVSVKEIPCVKEEYENKQEQLTNSVTNEDSCCNGFRSNNLDTKSFKRVSSNSQGNERVKKLKVGLRLKESDIGVTEFIGDHVGFSGIIKERYTDFHVNEIAINGEIAKLTNQDIPVVPEKPDDINDLKTLIPDEVWEQLEVVKEETFSSWPIEIDVTDMDKMKRKCIHITVQKWANVITQTIQKDKKKIMVIVKKNSKDRKQHKDVRIDWKKLGGSYCHFLLHKVNMDTMDALNQIASHLRIRANNFGYAGTKDRRAWTTQWVTLKRGIPANILRAVRNIRGVYVGNFKYARDALQLGLLAGNSFRIALRNVDGTVEQIEKAMTSLRVKGFINYFGLQRFGTVAAIPTYEIGKALLQGQWEKAVDLILKPREGEQDMNLVEAREIYKETKNAIVAYTKIRRSDKIEAALLKGLYTCGDNNLQGALDAIPRNISLMYIHAYQSLVWNYIVSKRIKEYGMRPIVGDLVYVHRKKQYREMDNSDYYFCDNDQDNQDDQDNEQETLQEQKDDAKDDEGDETTEDNATNIDKDMSEELHNLPSVKILTEAMLGNYTLADVIMPQPGWKVTYPPYAKPWFDEFLAKDGLTTDLRQKNKKYSLGGSYRKILQIPSDLSWKIVHYNEKHDDLIRCDIDELRGSPPLKHAEDGKYKALIIEISLKPSTYATMALREILKCDTSPEIQAARFASCNEEISNNTVDNKKSVASDVEFMTVENDNAQEDINMSQEVAENIHSQNDKKVDNTDVEGSNERTNRDSNFTDKIQTDPMIIAECNQVKQN